MRQLKYKGNSDAVQLAIMMLVTSLTQIVAIVKSSFIASVFGAGVELDAYHFANNLTTFFLTFVSAGITTVVLPAYVKKKSPEAVDTFISVVFSFIGILLAVLYIGRGLLVDVLTTRDSVFKGYVCSVMGLSIFIQLLPAILGVTTAYYQSEGKYNIPKVVLLITNLAVVAVLFIIREMTIYRYLWILLVGVTIQFAADVVIAVYYGFRFHLCFSLNNTEFRSLSRIFLPTVFSSGIYKVNTMVDSLLSSNLGVGQLTMLTYSNTIVAMVNNLLIGNLSTYAYPKIVKAMEEGDIRGQELLWNYSVCFHYLICLLIAGFLSVGKEFVGILYGHGKFSGDAVQVVYFCMCIYVFGQQNNIVRDLLYRYFYSKENTKTTTANSLTTSFINAVTSVILAHFIGLYGLVLGTVISGVYSLAGITWKLRKTYGFLLPMKPVALEFLKNETALLLTVGVLFAVKSYCVLPVVLSFIVFGFLTVGVYLLCSVLLGCRLIKGILK